MSLLEILAYAGAAVITLTASVLSREPKQYRCITGYSQCVSASVEEDRCLKILKLCEKDVEKKPEIENLPEISEDENLF